MRRAIPIALILGVACLLLYGCSSETNPIDPAVTLDSDLDKRPPDIYDPPPGFDPYLISLSLRFNTVQWETITTTLSIEDEMVTVYPPGYDPVDINFEVDKTLTIPAGGDPITFDVTILLPAKPPYGGQVDIPGDCIIFKTIGFPPDVYGTVTLALPIMEFYDQSDYTGTFTGYVLEKNAYNMPVPTEIQTIVVEDWSEPYPEVPVYIEIPEISGLDVPMDETDRAIDPGNIGDEE